MTNNVVWLDGSKRRERMAAAFGTEGDWLSSPSADLESCDALVLHFSNSGFSHSDEQISRGTIDRLFFGSCRVPDAATGVVLEIAELRRRLLTLRRWIVSATERHPPLVIYRGERTHVPEPFLQQVKQRFPNYPKEQVRFVAEAVEQEADAEICKGILLPYIEQGNAAGQDEERAKGRRQTEWETELRLIGDVVAWLEATRSGETPPPELSAITARLQRHVGVHGEPLAGRMADAARALGVEIRSGRFTKEWLEARLGKGFVEGRVTAWRRQGLLPENTEVNR